MEQMGLIKKANLVNFMDISTCVQLSNTQTSSTPVPGWPSLPTAPRCIHPPPSEEQWSPVPYKAQQALPTKDKCLD